MIFGFLLLSACGREGEASRSCAGPPLGSSEIKLPSDFPIPGESELTASGKTGTSQVIEGYHEGDLETTYHAWREALEGAGYSILFDEIEVEDSEIAYRSADKSSTGQIALRSLCEEDGRTFVHITNRPD